MQSSGTNRVMSVYDVINKKNKLLPFSGKWQRFIGNPELRGTIFIWGNSGHGKSTLVMQLIKYLSSFLKVIYNSMEEGTGETFKLNLIKNNMQEQIGKVFIVDNEPIDVLKQRLRKKRAPQVVVIDSIQYAEINYKQYKQMVNEFKNTLFIIISHSKGKQPAGLTADRIRYDSTAKIYVEGYVAFPTSRWGGNEPLVIWPQRAKEYHGIEYQNQ